MFYINLVNGSVLAFPCETKEEALVYLKELSLAMPYLIKEIEKGKTDNLDTYRRAFEALSR